MKWYEIKFLRQWLLSFCDAVVRVNDAFTSVYLKRFWVKASRPLLTQRNNERAEWLLSFCDAVVRVNDAFISVYLKTISDKSEPTVPCIKGASLLLGRWHFGFSLNGSFSLL